MTQYLTGRFLQTITSSALTGVPLDCRIICCTAQGVPSATGTDGVFSDACVNLFALGTGCSPVPP